MAVRGATEVMPPAVNRAFQPYEFAGHVQKLFHTLVLKGHGFSSVDTEQLNRGLEPLWERLSVHQAVYETAFNNSLKVEAVAQLRRDLPRIVVMEAADG